MAHLDKRIDPDKDATTNPVGRVKDGVSGNTPDSAEYQQNKGEDQVRGPAPDVPAKTGRTDAMRKR